MDAFDPDVGWRVLPSGVVVRTDRQQTNMPPPQAASTSPRFTASLLSQRQLPSRTVTEASIDNDFAAFILYSNPYYPQDTDLSELKRLFNSPPKSDGKAFGIFRLWELVHRLDEKDIKTWIQLALELGVEPPSAENGASVQKVQQYTVRLKRWMRALHVDAFFEYLLGKDHPYYTNLPSINDPHPINGRDGVSSDEDLALRAIDPTFRPKRGRKRNDSPETESSTPKRTMLTPLIGPHPQSARPNSSIPRSAHPDHPSQDPWIAALAAASDNYGLQITTPQSAATLGSSNLRWRLEQTPITPHPSSAAGGRWSAIDEPGSAITPSSQRPRRRHGPAVSSAWSGSNTPGGKPRGRPPGHRSTTDGPYSTFPVEMNMERSVTQPEILPTIEANETPVSATSQSAGRERLRLQVPQHIGGPVRLMTPPTVSQSTSSPSTSAPAIQTAPSRSFGTTQPNIEGQAEDGAQQSTTPRTIHDSTLAFETLKRALAADLLRADIQGRPTRLTGLEARLLSTTILTRAGLPSPTQTKIRSVARWLGLAHVLNRPVHDLQPATSAPPKRITITSFTTDSEGYKIPLAEADSTIDPSQAPIKHVFDVIWTDRIGALQADFSVRGLELSDEEAASRPTTVGDLCRGHENEALEIVRRVQDRTRSEGAESDDGTDWRAEYLAMEMNVRMMRGFFERAKEKVLDTVLSL